MNPNAKPFNIRDHSSNKSNPNKSSNKFDNTSKNKSNNKSNSSSGNKTYKDVLTIKESEQQIKKGEVSKSNNKPNSLSGNKTHKDVLTIKDSAPQIKKEEVYKPKVPRIKKEESLEDLLESYGSNKDETLVSDILLLMKKSHYKWVPLCQFCPRAFYQFLKNGNLNDSNFLIDLTHIMSNSIAGDPKYESIPWNTFLSALSICDVNLDRELYITKVSDTKKLIELHRLGYIDHRLDHSITLIQRLIRFHRNKPDYSEGWLNKFMEKSHQREESWVEHQIHLKSIRDIKQGLPDNAEDSIMYWNRQLIPEYLFTYYLKSQGKGYDIKIYCDIDPLVQPNFSKAELYQIKTDKITALMKNITTTDDKYKLYALINCYFSNRFNLWRDIKMDGLKFILIEDSHNKSNIISEVDRKNIIEHLHYYNYIDLVEIFKKLNICKYDYGYNIIKDFDNIIIDKLSLKEVKEWYTLVVLEDLSKTEFKLDFKDFLCDIECERHHKHESVMAKYIKSTLLVYQGRIRNKTPIVNPNDVIFYSKPEVSGTVLSIGNENLYRK